MEDIKRQLATTRLMTLSGVGGSGKIRLALEVARDLIEAYPDGVWLVQLAPLSEEILVPKAVAEALGVIERPGESLTDTLTDVLRARQLLLVVDNCEHLLEAVVRLLDALLDSCPRLRILATSREALGLEGEAAGLSLKPLANTPYDYEGYLATVRAGLEEADFEAAWSEGGSIAPEQAIEYALSAQEPSATPLSSATRQPSPPSAPEHPAGLTSREVEVLGFVASGMTSARIAKELFLSPRTVETHLTSIYHKLEVSTRSAATRFALEHNLA
jgi:DNA-binding CsgD family transcriptional regulator